MPQLDPNHYVDPSTGKLQIASGSPGLGGAISDAIKALASAFAPKAITQRPTQIEQTVNDATGAQSQPLGQQF